MFEHDVLAAVDEGAPRNGSAVKVANPGRSCCPTCSTSPGIGLHGRLFLVGGRAATSSVRHTFMLLNKGPAPAPAKAPGPGDEGWKPPPRQPSINVAGTLLRLLVLVAVLVVVANIPVNRHGVSLARMMPESSALIVRDGLVLKGSGPEIYRLEDDKLRWISSLDAFEHLGLTWRDVHVVDDEFLSRFQIGHPIHLVLKCEGYPHINALENGQKRWIEDIETFTAKGNVWDDVNFVTCPYLHSLPDGVPIPEDAGPAPEP